MIPTKEQCLALWDTYALPQKKRDHSDLVARVAVFLADHFPSAIAVRKDLLLAAALLHDIDKNVPKMEGERHPDAAVRILKKEDMEEVAAVVRRHSLHEILHTQNAPQSWEEKLLYLADKMVKQEVVGVDGRFALWRAEPLPQSAMHELDAAYPKVKALEAEVAAQLGIKPTDVTNYVATGILRAPQV